MRVPGPGLQPRLPHTTLTLAILSDLDESLCSSETGGPWKFPLKGPFWEVAAWPVLVKGLRPKQQNVSQLR